MESIQRAYVIREELGELYRALQIIQKADIVMMMEAVAEQLADVDDVISEWEKSHVDQQ